MNPFRAGRKWVDFMSPERIKCTKCKEIRPANTFNKCGKAKNGLQSECRSCAKHRKHAILADKELFRRDYSDCDSKLADKRLNNELKEVWDE